jgi:hypothetical protein
VHKKLEEAAQARLKDPIRERLHEILDDELRGAIAPLFADVCPNSGYRLLAALGRQRRVNVVTLNWDSAMEQACGESGVALATFDPLRGPSLEEVEATLPDSRGVLIAHAHGTLAKRPRYSLLETLPNPKIWETVAPLLAHTTIICGASLTGDIDVATAIHLAAGSERDASVWHFGRPAATRSIVEPPAHWWRVVSEDVDFDALVTALAEECWAEQGVAGARWNDLVRRPELVHLKVPRAEELVELQGAIRRGLFGARAAALVARPSVGKTVGVLRLAHLRMLEQAPAAELVPIFDPQDSVNALGLAAKRPHTIVVVDDPFGQGKPAENRRVVDSLREIASGGGGWAYVSSTDVNWNCNAGCLQQPHPGLAVPTRDPERWYETADLLRFAASTSAPKAASQLVHLHRAVTPPEVLEGARFGRVLTDKERADNARGLLDGDGALAHTCVLVRMQHLRESAIPEAELGALVKRDLRKIHGIEALLYRYKIDGRAHWTFAHPTIRQVTDGYLRDNHATVEHELLRAPVVPSWIRRSLEGWRLQQGIAFPHGEPFDADPPALGDWLNERLSSDPDDGLLREIAARELDEWETLEVAYTLVWVWNSVRGLPGADLLLRSLLGRPIGCYALLESCLYYQLGADDELWDRVVGRLWELSRDPHDTRERLLALDAVCWRESPNAQVAEWARRSLEELNPDTPAFGFVRFAAGYHPEGFASIASQQVLERHRRLGWTLAQACAAAHLLAWHFAHQSRARAMLHRYDHYDIQWLCQSGFDGEPMDTPDAAFSLAGSLIDRKQTSGWGFHLLCNLAAVAGLDLGDTRARELAGRALELAPRGDAGVISAVVAYEPTDTFRKEIQARICRLDERELYLDALADGIRPDPMLYVRPSRFRYIHDPEAVLQTIGAAFPAMDSSLGRLPPRAVAERLWTAARAVMADATLTARREVAKRIGRVERGDMRPTTAVLATRHRPDPDPYVEIVRRWRETIPSEPDLFS